MLGFEYGYSLTYPDALVIWEAQFGDFANVAQVIIDQFIASAEDKWGMPVGPGAAAAARLRGQGPEHSSARLERFLQLAAEDNIQIVNPTTPAQYFHLLRRQVLRHWRKPLVVMTPKSLLRHPRLRLDARRPGRGRVPDACCPTPTAPDPAQRAAGAAVQRQDLLRAGGRARSARSATTWPSCASSSSTRCPASALARRCARYRDGTPRCSGCRRSRRTWARGRYLRDRFGERPAGPRTLLGVCRPEAGQPGHRLGRQPQARTAPAAGPGLRPGQGPGPDHRRLERQNKESRPMPRRT